MISIYPIFPGSHSHAILLKCILKGKNLCSMTLTTLPFFLLRYLSLRLAAHLDGVLDDTVHLVVSCFCCAEPPLAGKHPKSMPSGDIDTH